MKKAVSISFLILISAVFSFAQNASKPGEITAEQLMRHVRYLSSDELQGRKTGKPGDSLASEYIHAELLKDGLVPLSGNGFQHFRVTDQIISGPNNRLEINGLQLIPEKDFAPFAFSQNAGFSGKIVFVGYGFSINDDSLKWNDYAGMDVKGKIVLMLRADPEIDKNLSPFMKYSRDRDKALQARDMGATAVLMVSGKIFDPEDKFEPLALGEQSVGIPVFRVSRTVADKILKARQKTADELERQLNEHRLPDSFETGADVSGQSDVVQTTVPSRNVEMLIPGTDPVLKNQYVVIGAHFDHLGLGGPGSGTRVPDTVAVHHGADDNASGTAMAIELARKLEAHPESHKRSIVVLAFSGEEMGLLGSKYFVEHPAINLKNVDAMINLDMVGRLTDSTRLQLSGVGTSPSLRKMIFDSCDTTKIRLALSDEGYGPSDHASFYGQDIPVLFLTSGAHLDYHTPLDTWDKINYRGMVTIAEVAYRIISDLADSDQKLAFQEAGPKMSTGRGVSRRKGVTLGIMPDFAGNVKNGLRADLITPGRPAAIGGMKKGDIIISINGKPVGNIQDYMFRLNQLKFGETIHVEVLRGGQKKVLIIQL